MYYCPQTKSQNFVNFYPTKNKYINIRGSYSIKIKTDFLLARII